MEAGIILTGVSELGGVVEGKLADICGIAGASAFAFAAACELGASVIAGTTIGVVGGGIEAEELTPTRFAIEASFVVEAGLSTELGSLWAGAVASDAFAVIGAGSIACATVFKGALQGNTLLQAVFAFEGVAAWDAVFVGVGREVFAGALIGFLAGAAGTLLAEGSQRANVLAAATGGVGVGFDAVVFAAAQVAVEAIAVFGAAGASAV